MDGGIVDSWKEMIKDDFKKGLREYVTLEKFFREIRKEFGKKDKGKGKKIEKENKDKKLEEKMYRETDVFWDLWEEKKKPKIKVTILRIPVVGRGSRFWKR